MASTRTWDRAAALPAIVDGRRLPVVVALPEALPTVAQLFDFMRDAELRFATLRMRIVERSQTARGEESVTVEVALRHPGEAKVTTTRDAHAGKAEYEIWISDGDLVRTYAAVHRLGTQRPIRNRPRGLGDRDIPGASKVYEPLTAAPDGDAARDVRPSRRVSARTSSRRVAAGSRARNRSVGREVILLECDHPQDDRGLGRPAGLQRGASRSIARRA